MGQPIRKSPRNVGKGTVGKLKVVARSTAAKRTKPKRGRPPGENIYLKTRSKIVKQNKLKRNSMNKGDKNEDIEFLKETDDESTEGSVQEDEESNTELPIKEKMENPKIVNSVKTPEAKIKLINVNALMKPLFIGDLKNEGSQVRRILPYKRGEWFMYRDYPYCIRERKKNIVIYMCTRKNCSGRFYVRTANQTVNAYRPHNHLPDEWVPESSVASSEEEPTRNFTGNEMYQELKRRSATETIPLKRVYEEVAARFPEGAKRLSYPESSMRKWRKDAKEATQVTQAEEESTQKCLEPKIKMRANGNRNSMNESDAEPTVLSDQGDDGTDIEFLEELDDESTGGSVQGDGESRNELPIKDEKEDSEIVNSVKTSAPNIELINVDAIIKPSVEDDSENEASQVRSILPYKKGHWVMYKDYPYCIRERKTNIVIYTCPRKNCSGRFYVRPANQTVNAFRRHNHSPDEWVPERNEMYQELKKRSAAETIPLKRVYEEVAARFPEGAKRLPYPESSMRKWRKDAKEEGRPKPLEPKLKIHRNYGNRNKMSSICGYQRGVAWIMYKNYPYYVREKKTTGTSYVCSRKTCPARIFARFGSTVVSEYKRHEHEPDAWVPQRNELYRSLKRRSMMESTPFKVIYKQEAARYPDGAKHLTYQETTMRKWRNDAVIERAEVTAKVSGSVQEGPSDSEMGAEVHTRDSEMKSSSGGRKKRTVKPRTRDAVREEMTCSKNAKYSWNRNLVQIIPPYKEGSTWIIYDGYPYCLKYRTLHGPRFKCPRPGCGVKLYVQSSEDRVEVSDKHLHQPDTWITQRNQLYQSLKKRASTEPTVPNKVIYREEAEKYPEGAKHILYSDKTMRMWRNSHPSLDQASEDECMEEASEEWLEEDFEEACSDEGDATPQDNTQRTQDAGSDEEYADTEYLESTEDELPVSPVKKKPKHTVYLQEKKSSLASTKKRKVQDSETAEDERDPLASKKSTKAEMNVKNIVRERRMLSSYRKFGAGHKRDLRPIAQYHSASSWVIFHQYPFYLRERKERGISYKCAYKGCNARLYVHHRTGILDQYSRHHHLPETWIPERNLLYQALRKRSFSELTHLKTIYNEEIVRYPEGAKHLPFLESSMRSWRKKAMVAKGLVKTKTNKSDFRMRAQGHESEVQPIAPYRIGSNYVMYRDYPYYLREKKPAGTSYKCSREDCGARIYVHNRTGAVDEYKQHDHPPESWVVSRNELYQELKRRSIYELTPIKEIFEQESARFPEGAVHIPNLESSMRSWRKNCKSVPSKLWDCQGDGFVKVSFEDQTAIILTSNNYERVTTCCHTVVVDSSFRALPVLPQVQRMVVMHAIVGDRASCPIIILFESDSRALYDAALAEVRLLTAFDSVINVYVGYDEDLNDSLRILFPDAYFQQHFFHYAQAVVRLACKLGIDFGVELYRQIVRMLAALAFLPRRHLKQGLLYVRHSARGLDNLQTFFNAYCDCWVKAMDINKISVYKDPERSSDVINNFQSQLLKRICAGHKSRAPNDWWQFINSVRLIQKSIKPKFKNYECWLDSSVRNELNRLLVTKEVIIPEFLQNVGELLNLDYLFSESDSLSKLNIDTVIPFLEANQSQDESQLDEYTIDENNLEIVYTYEKCSQGEDDATNRSDVSATCEGTDVKVDFITHGDDHDGDGIEADVTSNEIREEEFHTSTRGVNTVGFYFIKGLPIADDESDEQNSISNMWLTKTTVSPSRNTVTRATSPKIPKSLLIKHGLLKPIVTDSSAAVQSPDDDVSNESEPETEGSIEEELLSTSREPISRTAIDSATSNPDTAAQSDTPTDDARSTVIIHFLKSGAIPVSDSVTHSKPTKKAIQAGFTPFKGKTAMSKSPRLIPVVFKPLTSGTASKSKSLQIKPQSRPFSKSAVIRTNLGSKVILTKKSSSSNATDTQVSEDRCHACVVGIGEELCMVCGRYT